MAVIEGRRYPGILFYKVKGRREWLAVDHNLAASYWGGGKLLAQAATCFVEVNTGNPETVRVPGEVRRLGKVLTLTGVSQEYLSGECTPSSWRRMPEGWRRAFSQRINFCHPEPGDTWFIGGW